MRLPLAALLTVLAAIASAGKTAASDGVDVASFLKTDTFSTLKVSPTGEYLAATVPLGDRTGLAILRRSDGHRMAAFALGKDSHIDDFHWVNAERVLMTMARSQGQLDQPLLTGEIYGINADGSRAGKLVGGSIEAEGAATRVRSRSLENVWAFLVDDLPSDDQYAIMAISPMAREPFTRAERVDVYTGRGRIAARVPVQNARFTTDNKGVVRFAQGSGSDNFSKLYYRPDDSAEWKLINDEQETGRRASAIGFSPDDGHAYLRIDHRTGPDSIESFDPSTTERKPLFRDDNVDPFLVLYQTGAVRSPVGVMLMDGKTRTVFFDDASADARLYRSLEAAFPGDTVLVTSTTHDGRFALVQVTSASNPGDFYMFNRQTMQAEHIISKRAWLDPDDMATVEPVTLKARDGLDLHGYLTRPPGRAGAKLPLVVLPHGGPIGVSDIWAFDDEVQLLAQAGYAVLQVNFRGSANFGRAFRQAGARQFAGKMQDDVTDATRWAINQGIADPERICIYGASYGAFAALVGVAREPDLYRCAVGYVGLYDLPMRFRQLSAQSPSSRTWANDWMGPANTLGPLSPTTMADQIKAPVFLAAGGEDFVTPIEHSKAMEAALKRAGVPVETLYYPTEGHGFYTESRRIEYYTKLLEFLSRHLGGAKAKAPAKGG